MSPTLPSSPDAGNSEAVKELKVLADEYCELSKKERSLSDVLERLQREEEVLQSALKEASKSGAQRLQEERREKDATKISRLEQVLMESSSEEEDDGSNAMDVHSLFSYARSSATTQNLGGSTTTDL